MIWFSMVCFDGGFGFGGVFFRELLSAVCFCSAALCCSPGLELICSALCFDLCFAITSWAYLRKTQGGTVSVFQSGSW